MSDAAITAFVQEHQLSSTLVGPLQALVARLAGADAASSKAAEGTILLSDPERASGAGDEGPPHETPPNPEGLPDRYDDLGKLGVGGMGEVHRVRDRLLGRTCAYKVIRAHLANKPGVVDRFVKEAQVAAQLQHPNIAPVYDAGWLGDGRAWFTMREVRGRTLTELVKEVHAGEVTEADLRRLGEVFVKVCDGVGYAHARGVVHRDLKPENVMMGAHGDVQVLDWGVAKVLGRADRAIEAGVFEPGSMAGLSAAALSTLAGGVVGTAAYMAPEQARGEVDEVDPRSDVYSLGAILYELMSGHRPYPGRDAHEVVRLVIAGPPAALQRADKPTLPRELVALCERCMARDRSARPPDGAAVAVEMRAWLDGAHKRENAVAVAAEADGVVAEIERLRARAAALRAEGEALLLPVQRWAPEEDKAAGWAKLDEAESAERSASLLELRREGLLRGALTHAPDLAIAHAGLVELELTRHQAAEALRDERLAARAEVRLREHADALPHDHAMRQRAVIWLKGDGALSLSTDVPGVEVSLNRYEVRNRRLVPIPVQSLGRTPLRSVPLPMGSYLCTLRHPGRAEVRYPVSLGRGEHWDADAVRMPLVTELGADDCLLPASWHWVGGDPAASGGLPHERLWCDDLVMKRFPVTNREYLEFLHDLVGTGREAQALRHQPRERSAGEGHPVYGRDERGRFVLGPDADGDVWDPAHPVALVDWFGATAYGAWFAEKTGLPWRLPTELEWEKAARGVDGRFFPWGDGVDPSWCCMRASHPGREAPALVDSYPVDTSVYGVRGLAGNMQDWCAEERRPEGARAAREVRGGNWLGSTLHARGASRSRTEPLSRFASVGFRLVRRG